MKYIRTKDGIFDKEKCCIEGQVVKFSNEWFSVINQADKIEKLISCYVVITKRNTGVYHKCRYKPMPKEKILDLLKEGKEIYGAIWINVGLMYVAKMNNDGELELI